MIQISGELRRAPRDGAYALKLSRFDDPEELHKASQRIPFNGYPSTDTLIFHPHVLAADGLFIPTPNKSWYHTRGPLPLPPLW